MQYYDGPHKDFGRIPAATKGIATALEFRPTTSITIGHQYYSRRGLRLRLAAAGARRCGSAEEFTTVLLLTTCAVPPIHSWYTAVYSSKSVEYLLVGELGPQAAKGSVHTGRPPFKIERILLREL